MILYAKSFSRTDPERKPRDIIGFYSPHLDANKVIHKIPLRYLVSLLRGVSFIKMASNIFESKIHFNF